MIPDFESTNFHDEVSFLVALHREVEALSSTHIRWYTHKNPAGCWICDLFLLLEKWEDLYYPSPPKTSLNNVSVDNNCEEGVIKSD